MRISAADFEAATRREPIDDDLERVNCDEAGLDFGCHTSCGWCFACNLPVFDCGHSKAAS